MGGFHLQTLVDVSEQSRMAAEVMDFDCKMKSNGSTESKLELRLNRRIGRALTVMELCFVCFEEVCSRHMQG